MYVHSCGQSNSTACLTTDHICRIPGTELALVITYGLPILGFLMNHVIQEASARIRRQIAVSGDHALDPREEPFRQRLGRVEIRAWSNEGSRLTWGILDSVMDGLRYCGYDQGHYNTMECVIESQRDIEISEIGFVGLKFL